MPALFLQKHGAAALCHVIFGGVYDGFDDDEKPGFPLMRRTRSTPAY